MTALASKSIRLIQDYQDLEITSVCKVIHINYAFLIIARNFPID
jgi:hypothetical protein